MLTFLISIVVAGAFGFASKRGGLCVISAITAVVERRSSRRFLSFATCSLWAACSSWPIWWLVPRAHVAEPYPIVLATVLGGVAFGTGAAINSGCFFGTLTRLATGDLSFLATLGGIALGANLTGRLPQFASTPASIGEGLVARSSLTGIVLLSLVAVLCFRRLPSLLVRSGGAGSIPKRAFAIVGLSGGVLFALNGAWLYPLAGETGTLPSTVAVLSASTLGGAVLASMCQGDFVLRAPWRSVPSRLIGGMGMGFGSTLTPGGNTTLLLQSIPAISPHAFVGYLALSASAALVLAQSPKLRRLGRTP